jgi:hypothetical protein
MATNKKISDILKTEGWKKFYKSRMEEESAMLDSMSARDRIRYSLDGKNLDMQKLLSEFIEKEKQS